MSRLSRSWNGSLVPRLPSVIPEDAAKCVTDLQTCPEPPIGIEPMTYALRGARSPAADALAAPMPRAIAQMALSALGFCGDPFHDPFRGRSRHTRLPLAVAGPGFEPG